MDGSSDGSDGINGNIVSSGTTKQAVTRTESKKSFDSEESESEPYHDCDVSNSDEDDIDDIDAPDDRDSLEFEYEPGISLSSLQFYQTCQCQNESESGDI